jgi:hypothetical protein
LPIQTGYFVVYSQDLKFDGSSGAFIAKAREVEAGGLFSLPVACSSFSLSIKNQRPVRLLYRFYLSKMVVVYVSEVFRPAENTCGDSKKISLSHVSRWT